MFFKIGVFKNFAIFTGKHLCWSLFLICCPVNVTKFLRTSFFTEHLRWLLLYCKMDEVKFTNTHITSSLSLSRLQRLVADNFISDFLALLRLFPHGYIQLLTGVFATKDGKEDQIWGDVFSY